MDVEEFAAEVREWFTTATHPVLHRPYLSCGFVPMIELLRYLEANGFTTYIASGGDRDFMRPFADGLYGIPPERIIGSALGLELDADCDVTGLLYKSQIEFFDDGPTKPVRIWSRLGRRPLVAVGNSNGDIEMLRFARSQPPRRAARPAAPRRRRARERAYDQGRRRRPRPGGRAQLDRRVDARRLDACLPRRLTRTRSRTHHQPEEHTAMATLTVWKFDTATGATEAVATLESLSNQNLITIHDAATVTWAAGRKKPKTVSSPTSPAPAPWAARSGASCSGLLFFVPCSERPWAPPSVHWAASMADVGIDDDFIASVREKVTPGTSALFLLTSDAVIDKVADAFSASRAELIQTNLSEDEEAKLREAFAEDAED